MAGGGREMKTVFVAFIFNIMEEKDVARERTTRRGSQMDHASSRIGRIPHAGRWWAPGDIAVALAVVALSAFLIAQGVADAGAGSSSSRAVVSVNGREVRTLPLGGDVEELPVGGYRGMSYIQARGDKVRMLDSACPDKLCVHSGWISRPGESVVCLPNRVVIEIRSGEEGPDAVNR